MHQLHQVPSHHLKVQEALRQVFPQRKQVALTISEDYFLLSQVDATLHIAGLLRFAFHGFKLHYKCYQQDPWQQSMHMDSHEWKLVSCDLDVFNHRPKTFMAQFPIISPIRYGPIQVKDHQLLLSSVHAISPE